MFYQNGNYMQDLNYFNQNGIPNVCNSCPQNNFMNPNNMQFIQQQNLNAMYPAVYRIIAPVVFQVLQNSNTQFFTEDTLNSLVDTVYSIVEGDLNLTENTRNISNQSDQQNSPNRDRTSQPNANTLNINSNEKQNLLLKDLIKIIFLNSIRQNNKSGQWGRGFLTTEYFLFFYA